MSGLPDLHFCQRCGVYLGPDNGDGLCAPCDTDAILIATPPPSEANVMMRASRVIRARLCLVAIVEPWRAEVTLVMADMLQIRAPYAAFAPSGTGLAPDWTQPAVRDHGQTLAFGAYEASVEAIREEYGARTE